jgi:hypothetical protein
MSNTGSLNGDGLNQVLMSIAETLASGVSVPSSFPPVPSDDGYYALYVHSGRVSWRRIAWKEVGLIDDDDDPGTDPNTDEPDPITDEYFSFTINTDPYESEFATKSFSIPTGQEYEYSWVIDWGDGSPLEAASGVGVNDSPGISHEYAEHGSYLIKIGPNKVQSEWFRAFGFWSGSYGANASVNKDKIIAINSPLTVAMFAEPDATVLGDNVGYNMFRSCQSLTTICSGFFSKLSEVTEVGNSFACFMFGSCAQLEYLPADFNFPQAITKIGDDFGRNLFIGCSKLASLPTNFNFPPLIEDAKDGFGEGMFYQCISLTALTNNFRFPYSIKKIGHRFGKDMFNNCQTLVNLSSFQLPSGGYYVVDHMEYYLTEVGDSFAEQMFKYCYALTSGIGLPNGLISVGNRFIYGMYQDCRKLSRDMGWPENITSIGTQFAVSSYNGCSAVTSISQFPQGLSQSEINKTDVFNGTYANINSDRKPLYATFAIGTLPEPDTRRYTFTNNCTDYASIPSNWK